MGIRTWFSQTKEKTESRVKEAWAREENRENARIFGIGLLAAGTVFGGVALVKGLFVTKAVTTYMVTPTTLIASSNSGLTSATASPGLIAKWMASLAQTSSSTSIAPASVATTGTTTSTTATSFVPAATGSSLLSSMNASLSNATSSAVNSTVSSAFNTIGGQVNTWLNAGITTIANNAIPITAGLAGGGATGYVAAGNQAKKTETRLQEQIQAQQAETEQLRQQVQATEAQVIEIKSAVVAESAQDGATAPDETPEVDDRLIEIDGIGPIYTERLVAAGITTLEQFMETPDERIEEIVLQGGRGSADVDDWKVQGRSMMEG
ncbi:MAG: hypothetical protein AAF639_43140 [Chloroflexota bacterium]